MKPVIIQQGAEAIIYQKDKEIIKQRIKKSYRFHILDEKLRKLRTRSEARILEKLQKIIPIPKLIKINETNKELVIEYINGKKLSENLEKLNYEEICKKIAENISKMHDLDIIHGDLTTSNMIYKKDKNNKVYFIDFGLSFHSKKVEDKAVDLHLLKQAFDSKHYTITEECINIILKNYKVKDHEKILKQLKKVESRGRYKGRY